MGIEKLIIDDIAPLIKVLAQWERDNGTLSCIDSTLCEDINWEVLAIIADWAGGHSMRSLAEYIKEYER